MAFPDIVKILQGAYNYKQIDKFLAEQVKHADWNSVITNATIIFVINLIFELTLFNYIYNEVLMGSMDPSIASLYPPMTALTLTIQAVLSIVIFLPLFVYSIQLLAGFFKGKGKAMDMAYLYTTLTIAFIVPSLLFASLMIIPLAFCLVGIISLAFSIYTYYVYYRIIRFVYGIDRNGAIITLIGAVIIATMAVMAVNVLINLVLFLS